MFEYLNKCLSAASVAAVVLASCNSENVYYEGGQSCKVYEYTPAPGQFINENFTATTPAEACAYAQGRLEKGQYVSLGGFGGYIVVGFGESIPCGGPDAYDIEIVGNSFDGSSEPGIVWVMRDTNGNGLPDDGTWYELRGSEYDNPGTKRNYSVTYVRPSAAGEPVAWTDSEGASGFIRRNDRHQQAYYFPLWVDRDSFTLTGTRLPDNSYIDPDKSSDNGTYWVTTAYGWGYVDNNGSNNNRFRIADAVDRNGNPANLASVDFIKIQTAINADCGALGEISTEVCRVRNLHVR